MKYFRKIEGAKLYLSPVNPEDFELYTKWVNNLSMAVRLGVAANAYSLQQEKGFLETMAKEGHNYAIVLKDNDQLIGNCSLFDINHIHRTAVLGLFIGEENQRSKGFGTEAIQLLVEYGFRVLNLNNIMLLVNEFNIMAQKCYEKVGFKVFGRRTKSYYLDGKYYDHIYMEMLASGLKTSFLDNILPKA